MSETQFSAPEIGEVWDGRHYDPKFFRELSAYALSMGDKGRADLYTEIADQWDVAWAVANMFGAWHRKAVSQARVAVPPIHTNRKARRLMAAVGRSTKAAGKARKALEAK